MYYWPYNNYYAARQINSYIRLFHASPGAPAVDIYANGNLIVKNLSYKGLSPYLPTSSGSYNVRVYPSGQTANPVINTNVFIPENTVFNVAVIGTLPDVILYPIPEPATAQKFGRPCVRFVHLSPNAPAVDVKLSDGTIPFTHVSYKDITNYACILPGTYTFTVSPNGSSNSILTIPNVKLGANNYYTIYAVGLVGKAPALEAIPILEPRQ